MNVQDITPEQLAALQQWAAEGLDLNQIQKKLDQEFGLKITYMETRFLLMDLDIRIAQPTQSAPSAESQPVPEKDETPSPAAEPGSTRISIDDITPSHALLSGKVTFESGCMATWMISRAGGLSYDPIAGQPTKEDLIAFQRELNQVIRQEMGGF